MPPAPPLTELITTVETDADAPDPLARLATASAMAGELTESADALVGHFVERCRAAGRTWAEISEALGVSKQAAHKRYTAVPNEAMLMSRFTERARQAVAHSRDAARGLGHPFIGTEHVLLGLFPPGGIGASLLAESGITETVVAERALAHTPRSPDLPQTPPYTPRAAQVFSGALSEALAFGHNYVGTEHLVLALFRDPEGLAAKILAEAGATHAGYKQRIVTMLSGFTTPPPPAGP